MAVSIYLLIIALNINVLNAPSKRHRVANWIKEPRTFNILSMRDSLQGEKCTD